MARAVRKGLTKAKILNESGALVDSGGPSALTMRALATRLGVAPMAIYNHFRDRDAILDAMADAVFERLRAVFERLRNDAVAPRKAVGLGSNARRETQWRRTLKAVLMSAQYLAAQHPHIFRVALTRPVKPVGAFVLATETLGVLEHAGLSRIEALTVYHAFVILLQGYPFWHEGLEQNLMAMPVPSGKAGNICDPSALLPSGRTPERQFEAIVDWLLGCVAETGKTRPRNAPKPKLTRKTPKR